VTVVNPPCPFGIRTCADRSSSLFARIEPPIQPWLKIENSARVPGSSVPILRIVAYTSVIDMTLVRPGLSRLCPPAVR